jgi:cytochrome o ubiquinol oxidase subunit 3
MLGFWIYLMSDCLIFAILFATYGVLGGNYAAGPVAQRPVRPAAGRVNTSMLLLSSITYGFAMLAMDEPRSAPRRPGWPSPACSASPSSASNCIRIRSHDPRGRHAAAQRLSVVLLHAGGTHGLHVTFGLVWLVTLMVQVARTGLIEANKRRLMCLSMFWHFLDVVWIGVFSFVYLMGVLR